MKSKIQNLFLAASLLVGALGFGGTAQAILFSGNTNTSSPATIATYLTYTSATFSNLDVPVGLGSTSLTDLGQFTITVCSGNNCQEPFGTQDGAPDFTLRITFTDPTVSGSPAFDADIYGTIFRSGNSNNIGNGSSLTINFDNTAQTLNYSTSLGSGSFDLSVNDPLPYDSTSAFGNTRTVTGQIANLTFTPNPCTQNCGGGGTAAIPEPSTLVLVGAGLLVFARRMRSKKN